MTARASQSVAQVERHRLERELYLTQSADIALRKVEREAGPSFLQLRNLGQHVATDVKVVYEGLRFQTLMETMELGLSWGQGKSSS